MFGTVLFVYNHLVHIVHTRSTYRNIQVNTMENSILTIYSLSWYVLYCLSQHNAKVMTKKDSVLNAKCLWRPLLVIVSLFILANATYNPTLAVIFIQTMITYFSSFLAS